MTPLFSCVIPVKGARPFMDAALESLRVQGMGDALEIIVQDGDVEPDAGQSDALNKGFAKAKGEWLFWLNADDVLLPGALKGIASLIERAERPIEWIAGNTVYIGKDGKATDARWNKRWHPFLYRHITVWTGGPSAFFRRELFGKTGGFDTSLKYTMDIDLWTRMAQAGAKYEVADFPVWGFRWHEGSLTAGGAHEEEHMKERSLVSQKHGLGHQKFWRNVLRCVQLLDGSYLRRIRETRAVRGVDWRMIGRMP